jgi:hypothetical protein
MQLKLSWQRGMNFCCLVVRAGKEAPALRKIEGYSFLTELYMECFIYRS